MGKVKRNIVIVQALNDISRKAVGERADFKNCLYLAALKGHTACHDKSDIT
jgi:hypothetical protein